MRVLVADSGWTTGCGIDPVVDSLFAAPMAAALRATKYGGRIVNLGMRAGRAMELSGLAWKGRDLLNYNLDLPPVPTYRAAYEQLAQHVLAGELVVRSEVLPDQRRRYRLAAPSPKPQHQARATDLSLPRLYTMPT